MNNYWFFGCSHSTSDYNLNSHNECWTSILAKSMKYNEVNLAKSGCSNDTILLNVIHNLPKFSKNDKIFVLLTLPERFFISGEDIRPSEQKSKYIYKVINDDAFFQNKFLQTILALKTVLTGFDYNLSFVDPTLIIELFCNQTIKQLIKDEHLIILPKLTLSKSFELGKDRQHLSPLGHQQISEFFINQLV